MWKRRTYLNRSIFRKRKKNRADKQSEASRGIPSTRQKVNSPHLPVSEARVVIPPDATSYLPQEISAGTGEECHGKFSPNVSNPELELLNTDDWDLLRANDTRIREQRRFAGSDGLPREDRTTDARYGETPRVGQSTPDIAEMNSDDVDTFFDLYPWKDQDYEYEEAQLQFERKLANEDQSTPPDDAPSNVEETIDEVADSWFDGTDGTADNKGSGFEWDELALDADEFDEVPDRADLLEVRTDGRVSREVRALQEATELAEEYEWDEHGRELLAIVFSRYYWSSAKGAMKRELEKGMIPSELELALGLRDFWRERTEFSIDLGYWRSGAGGASDISRATYRILSWPAALRLTRLASTIPDQAEIEVLLDELYLEWYSSSGLRRRYPSFRVYLYRWLDYTASRSDVAGTWHVNMDAGPGKEFFEDDELTWLIRHRDELARQGLLPIGGDEPYVEWMSRAERKILGETLTARSELCP